ncbi:hypothetical protein ACO0LO_16350 [Undibacterium sp. TJN25]|uniref:hypothetical protein n=1 Tax=Undibacterium sp. TJN25 TaxID=3413056 RepID=UPI003BF1F08C
MSGTLLALSAVSLNLNLDNERNDETQCMLVVASQRTILLIANNDDNVTEGWKTKYELRSTGSSLLDDAVSRALFPSPGSGSKKLIYNNLRGAFDANTLERLKHKKHSEELGHLNLSSGTNIGSVDRKEITTILVTGNTGDLKTVSGVVHAEQKLMAAVHRIEQTGKLSIQEVWVAGCKRACNLCHTKLVTFRQEKSFSYEFQFESPRLTACQGSQRTAAYD